MNLLVHDLQEYRDWISSLQFPEGALVLLSGPMAAGKTEFVKIWCELHQVQGVSSPSFGLHQQYSSRHGVVHHFDLFRMKNSADIESTGFWEVLNEPSRIVFIEWPERIEKSDLPPRPVFEIQISLIEKTSSQRKIQFKQL
ncbi:MAG: tRNA (adenosine(37)-N6)-threonylcarbamoyltransferase complex ATPase subunit type 1 TsaE [Proteobacteria bacterium]|nr:tRNA (adenosine(37)-N6)-threonylcarbamoyltransferase complex ATPase subunit type 1 TsaE [Pseudomonadota bacterium]